MCPVEGLDEATVYVYDNLPSAHLLFFAPPTYQSINNFKITAAECCRAGETWPVIGVLAVMIRQLVDTMLSIAECGVFLTTNLGTNVASQATCYSLPAGGGGYYMGG